MNNEKLILEALYLLLEEIESEKIEKTTLKNRIREALNPKEDVPYEDSLGYGLSKCCKAPILIEGNICTKCEKPVKFAKSSKERCKNCGKVEERHAGFEKRCSLKSKEVFVSSSINEKEKGQ